MRIFFELLACGLLVKDIDISNIYRLGNTKMIWLLEVIKMDSFRSIVYTLGLALSQAVIFASASDRILEPFELCSHTVAPSLL